MKMVYIASPYSYKSNIPFLSKLVRYLRYKKVTRIIGKLQDRYPNIAFIGPITQSHLTAKYMKNGDTGFNQWRNIDLTFISRCDEVWVVNMPGWRVSQGVTEEMNFAIDNKIPVFMISHKTNAHLWNYSPDYDYRKPKVNFYSSAELSNWSYEWQQLSNLKK